MPEQTELDFLAEDTVDDRNEAKALTLREPEWNPREPVIETWRAVDLAFGRLLERLDPACDPAVRLAGMLASRWVGEGHSCVDLARHAGRCVSAAESDAEAGRNDHAPPLATWLRKLETSPLVARPGELAPLVLEEGRLYLHRYWRYETEIAARLSALMARLIEVDETRLGEGLRRLFPATGTACGTDWQQIAAALAVLKRFAVITGGPGTGKTYTVTRILSLLIEQAPDDPPRIALAAPTGKARARLADSIEAALASGLSCEEKVTARIREVARTARTLHGLLGMVPGRSQCRHGLGHPLPYDVVVVDEASMIDLPLMSHLLAALSESCRLILLGDRNQLPPVEVGNLLGDLCAAAGEGGYSAGLRERLEALTGQYIGGCTEVRGASIEPQPDVSPPIPLIRDSLAELRTPRRFAQGSGIAALAEAIQQGDLRGCVTALETSEDLEWRESGRADPEPWLSDIVRDFVRPYFGARDVEEALARFNAFRILCVLRQGPFGVEAVNRAIVRLLLGQWGGRYGQGEWYQGRPIMVTRNDPTLALSNGDIGLTWPDPAAGHALRVFFVNENGAMRALSPARLPPHETVFCMTVHKSQGSEFGHVHLILPNQGGPLLCRELIYTAVTRAKTRLSLYGSRFVLAEALRKCMERSSGLHRRLGQASSIGGIMGD